ncbi:MAG: thermonuclease family protein [Bdellovibrionales bacterium]|nr:thermonuclease family protein [Bdellovibrionales bacterium]
MAQEAMGRESIEAAAKCRASEWEGVEKVSGQVVRTADGDTARVRVDGREFSVRFLSIDTPETHYEGMSQGYWGEKAAERLAELLPVDTRVSLEFEDEPCDKYGRMLAHVWKGTSNVNKRMVSEGLAVNYCIYPNVRHCLAYGREAQRNLDAGNGMYGDDSLVLPYEWRRLVSDRPDDRWVGDIHTHEVHAPGGMDNVPVGARVFFFKQTDVPPPYHVVEP